MAAKNSISVLIEKEQILLLAFLRCGISAKKARIVSKTHVSYLFTVTHYQTSFELGYHFAEINRVSLSNK